MKLPMNGWKIWLGIAAMAAMTLYNSLSITFESQFTIVECPVMAIYN